MRQILLNLLSNAVKFTENGGVKLKMGLQHDTENVLQFSISDTGMGIADEQLLHIFEPFVQVGEHTHLRHAGTGLGLAITRQLVEVQGGAIQVHSSLGKGTTFTFYLPVQISAAPQVHIPTKKVQKKTTCQFANFIG